ncbi:MAG: THUMP domain-containing protein [Desulfatibacillaceae bacterium]|nr:THUMP domain-containing protein [Desulfatibacillaceae bacterium]
MAKIQIEKKAPARHQFFALTPQGAGPIAEQELLELGLAVTHTESSGVAFEGPLAAGYTAILWSRVASRVGLLLSRFEAASDAMLYQGAVEIAWEDHFAVPNTFAVDVTGAASFVLNTKYAAQRVKDAVADRFRDRFGARPSVDTKNPDIRLLLHLGPQNASIYLDISGGGLHQRGYREHTGPAPLRENLAAIILLRCGWPQIARRGGALLDPMCGSGTLLIEGAMMAADIAPGLFRKKHGFECWKGHDLQIWDNLINNARTKAREKKRFLPPIVGGDRDPAVVKAAMKNAFRAGLADFIVVRCRDISLLAPPKNHYAGGLVLSNPPYGERMGQLEDLEKLYTDFGRLLREKFVGWKAAVFTSNPSLAGRMGIVPASQEEYYNGPIACQLVQYAVSPANFEKQ